MGLFFGKKKENEPKPNVEKIIEVCDCCGEKLKARYEINPEGDLAHHIALARDLGSYDIPVQCEFYKFKYGDKKICGYCFSQVLNDITGEVYGPLDFLQLEDYKINHINKLFSEMSLEELKARKKKFDDKMAELHAAEAKAQAEAEAEWLSSLK